MKSSGDSGGIITRREKVANPGHLPHLTTRGAMGADMKKGQASQTAYQKKADNLINDILVIAEARKRGVHIGPFDYDFEPELANGVIDDLAATIVNLAHIVANQPTAKELEKAFEKAVLPTLIKDIAPAYKEGMKRIEQLHAPRQKKNNAILAYCIELMQNNASPSAQHLFDRFPKTEATAVIRLGHRIFRDCITESGETIYYITPAGKRKTLKERAFANYFQKVKESLQVNS